MKNHYCAGDKACMPLCFQVQFGVLDSNDNTPQTIHSPILAYSLYLGLVSVAPIGSESDPHTCLLRVRAEDKDSGLNGQVCNFYILKQIQS